MKRIRLFWLVLPLALIAAGFKSEPQIANEFGQSLLQVVADGDIDQVKSLLSQGADVNAKDEKGQTALHLAVREGHLALAELLLSKGAEVDVKDKFGWTALNCRSNLVTGPSSISKRFRSRLSTRPTGRRMARKTGSYTLWMRTAPMQPT